MTDKVDEAIAATEKLTEAADLTFPLDTGRQIRIIFPADLTLPEAMQTVATVATAIAQTYFRNEAVRNPASRLVLAKSLT